jgi:type I restriction enzyme M protein
LPEGRKSYTKTQPVQYEEFAPLLAWWNAREENERAWRVPVADILRYTDNGALLSANLDIKNPNQRDDFEHLPPEQLVRDILDKEQQIIALMQEIQQALSAGATP